MYMYMYMYTRGMYYTRYIVCTSTVMRYSLLCMYKTWCVLCYITRGTSYNVAPSSYVQYHIMYSYIVPHTMYKYIVHMYTMYTCTKVLAVLCTTYPYLYLVLVLVRTNTMYSYLVLVGVHREALRCDLLR